VSSALPHIRETGIRSVRIWYRIRDWNSRTPDTWFINRAAEYKQAGFQVMLTVLADRSTDVNTARGFFQMLANQQTLVRSVDLWQIGNEVNHAPFWSDTMANYVNNMLKPAHDVLRGIGAKIVGAGPTGNTQDAYTLRDLGYLNYIDYAAFHPYAGSGDEVISKAQDAARAFAGKPLIITEWNITSGYNSSSYGQELDRVRRALKEVAVAQFYFSMINFNAPNGIFRDAFNYQRNDGIFNEVRSWQFE